MKELVSAARIPTRSGDKVSTWWRENGVLRSQLLNPEWITYHRKEHLDAKPELLRSRHIKSTHVEGEWVRISWDDENTRRVMCRRDSPFAVSGVEVFEGDVGPTRRIITDRHISIQKPRRVFLDIETDSRVSFSEKESARVLSWAIVGQLGDELIQKTNVLAEFTDVAERELLAALWKEFEEFDQVVAWNGDGFDFPVIQSRSRLLGVGKGHAERLLWLDQYLLFKKMNVASESGEEKQSYALNAVAKHLLGEGKIEFDSSKTWEAWNAGGQAREDLVKYNLQDTALLPRIEAKTGFIELFQTVCEVCSVFPETRATHPTIQMDGYMLRLGKERGVHFPTKYFRDNVEKFDGAYVMQPEAHGIMKNVHVADFASLYPSIIITWNMSPDTKGPKRRMREHVPEEFSWSPLTYQTFDTRIEGILPIALRSLLDLRKAWNEQKSAQAPGTAEWKDADRKSTAYKVIANSFYGCLGNSGSRYYDREIAESVTQCGKWLILKTIDFAKMREIKTLYGDTDSIFATNASQTDFEIFVKWANNDLYPSLIQEVNGRVNAIKLAYEKAFERVIFVGAKKYVGKYLHYKGKAATADSKPEIRGLEYRRGDAAVLARSLQYRAIEMLMSGVENRDEYVKLVESTLQHVLFDELPLEEIRFAKSISRPLKDYKIREKKDGTPQSEPEHVTVARELQRRGRDVREGTKIEYYVYDGADGIKAAPIEDLGEDRPADRYYLWEAKIYPPTQRLLQAAFPDHGWQDAYGKQRPARRGVLEGQQSLFGLSGGMARLRKVATEMVRIMLEEDGPLDALQFREVVQACPGDDTLEVDIRTRSGAIARLACPQRVDAKKLEEELFSACVQFSSVL